MGLTLVSPYANVDGSRYTRGEKICYSLPPGEKGTADGFTSIRGYDERERSDLVYLDCVLAGSFGTILFRLVVSRNPRGSGKIKDQRKDVERICLRFPSFRGNSQEGVLNDATSQSHFPVDRHIHGFYYLLECQAHNL